MGFDPDELSQGWPAPSTPRPVVVFGAGSIVADAHLPAYARGGFPVAGIYDPDRDKARALSVRRPVAQRCRWP